MRERLHHNALGFLRSAFYISGRCADAREVRLSGLSVTSTQRTLDQVHNAHSVFRDELTALRLIAPADVIDVAEKMHDCHHILINYAFGIKKPDDDEFWEKIRADARESHANFLTALRRPLGLDLHEASISDASRSSWRFPADVYDPSRPTDNYSHKELDD